MAKVLKTGGEVDSWCTKCKLMLNHRIIAMVGTKPVRVECSTCSSHHNYRAHAPGEAPRVAAVRSTSSSGAAPRAPRETSATRAEAERRDRAQSWEKAVSGKLVTDFKRYTPMARYDEGDLLRHSKFGDGVVLRVLDAAKLEVLFKDETRTLAQGLT